MILMSKYKGKHGGKKGQKIRAWVDPPLIRAMPERKRFFSSLMSSLRNEWLLWHSPGELEARGMTGTAALRAVWKGDGNEISKPDNWSFLRLYFVQNVVIIWPISSSGPWPVFLFSLASPRQKSQYLVASTWTSFEQNKKSQEIQCWEISSRV